MSKRDLIIPLERVRIITEDEKVDNFPGALFCHGSCPCFARFTVEDDQDPMYSKSQCFHFCGLTRKPVELGNFPAKNKAGYNLCYHPRTMDCLHADPEFGLFAEEARNLQELFNK